MKKKDEEYKISPKLIFFDQAEKFLSGMIKGYALACAVLVTTEVIYQSIMKKEEAAQ